MTERLALKLALVLPGIPDERDSCTQRLADLLKAQGLEKVHVVRQDGQACLCLHYDPTQFVLQQVRSMVEVAGAQLSARYRHELMRIDGAFLGLLALADTPRPGMREVFARLASFGIDRTVMLTGDNEPVAKAVAACASIEPYAWVLNKSVLAAGTRDPLLAARLAGERRQMERMASGLAKRIFTLAWLTVPPIGFAELSRLVGKPGVEGVADAAEQRL